MSAQTDAIGSTGLEQTYGQLVKDLEPLEHDLFESGLSEDSLFIDDVILRLKVWASEINVQGGTLIALNNIGTLASKIQSRLDDIGSLTKDAGTSSTQKRPLAEIRSHFLGSLDSLAMFVEPIKTIGTQSSTDEKDYGSGIEAHLRTSNLKGMMAKPDWNFLRNPVAEARFPRLLGVIVTDPTNPTDTEIPNLALTELVIKDLVIERVSRDALISKSSSKSRQPYSSTLRAPKVYSRFLLDQSLAFARLQDYADEVRKMLKERGSSKAFLITGVMSVIDLSLEQGIRKSRRWKMNMPASGSGVGAEAGISAEKSIEESASFEYSKEVISDLKYLAIRITHFTKKLRRGDLNIKKNDFTFF